MTIAAGILTVLGMAAAVRGYGRSPLRAVGAVGMGVIMLGVLMVPGLSSFTAAAGTLALLLLVVAAAVAVRMRRRRPFEGAQKSVLAVTVVDITFMAATVLVMPAHGATLASSPGAPGFDPHMVAAGGWTIWLVLAAWAVCVGALIGPALRVGRPGGLVHLVCSGGMIAAMAVMAG